MNLVNLHYVWLQEYNFLPVKGIKENPSAVNFDLALSVSNSQ